MKIHIVAPDDGWILDRWAQRWAHHLRSTKSPQPRQDVDINFYVNYAMYGGKTSAIDACYFTHKEEGGELAQRFDQVASECDLCIVQSNYTRSEFPANRPNWVVWPGVDEQFHKEKIIGVIGKEKPNGRKRFEYLKSLDIPGVEIRIYDSVPYEQIHEVYKEIDYLLVASTREGGPMCVAEAIGMGVPIIMPEGVGWYSEVPCMAYSSDSELEYILKGLAGWITWEKSSQQLMGLFEGFMV